MTSTLASVESGAKVYVLTHHGVNAAQRVRTAQLTQKYTVGSAAVFPPEGLVVVSSEPDDDGMVEVISPKQDGKKLRAPLAALEELPELPPMPEGEPTDYWTVTDDKGQEVTRVRAETLEGARDEVEKDPQAAAVAKRLGGLGYRRLFTSELPPEIRAAVEAEIAGVPSWWAVKNREGFLVGQVQAATYEQALKAADQDPQVCAASPQADGLTFMRLATTDKAAPYSFGCNPESAAVPQVKAARNVLVRDGKRLAAFNDTHTCVSAGAYLDPRRSTGEVVLGYCSEDRQDHCGRATMWDSEELHAERERIINAYADLFRVADWTVQEFRERDRTGRERLARLILTPPR